MVSYWFAILSSSILNRSARSLAIDPAPPPPPPPPACRPVCTCSSNSSSACCRNCSAQVLRRQRTIRTLRLQLLLRGRHLLGRLRQQLRDLLERRIRHHEAAVHALHQAVDLLFQLALRQRQHDHRFAELVGLERLAIALHVERAGDDLPLLLRQRADFLSPAAAATAATTAHRGGRLEVLVERPDAQEIDVARRRFRAGDRVVVGRLGVVRDRVARLHAELFHVEGVAGRDFRRRPRAVEQADGLLGSAVHRIHQLQVLHRIVIVGLRFDEELLHRRGVGVASRLRQLHRGRQIRQQVDRVLRRRRHVLAGRPIELDAVEAVLLRREFRGQRAVRVGGQRHAAVFAEHDAAALRRHRRRDRQRDVRAFEHGDVAAVFDLRGSRGRCRPG